MNINDRNEALRFESELDRVKQERNRLRSGLEEKIEEWGACIEENARLEAELAALQSSYDQLASDYEYDKRTEELNDRYEKALQSIINYQSLCYNTGLGGRCLECPTCTARKALGDKEDEITVRLGRGEDPRGF